MLQAADGGTTAGRAHRELQPFEPRQEVPTGRRQRLTGATQPAAQTEREALHGGIGVLGALETGAERLEMLEPRAAGGAARSPRAPVRTAPPTSRARRAPRRSAGESPNPPATGPAKSTFVPTATAPGARRTPGGIHQTRPVPDARAAESAPRAESSARRCRGTPCS